MKSAKQLPIYSILLLFSSHEYHAGTIANCRAAAELYKERGIPTSATASPSCPTRDHCRRSYNLKKMCVAFAGWPNFVSSDFYMVSKYAPETELHKLSSFLIRLIVFQTKSLKKSKFVSIIINTQYTCDMHIIQKVFITGSGTRFLLSGSAISRPQWSFYYIRYRYLPLYKL